MINKRAESVFYSQHLDGYLWQSGCSDVIVTQFLESDLSLQCHDLPLPHVPVTPAIPTHLLPTWTIVFPPCFPHDSLQLLVILQDFNISMKGLPSQALKSSGAVSSLSATDLLPLNRAPGRIIYIHLFFNFQSHSCFQ